MKAIILAGGLGTRLRPVIGNDVPKCMAPVMGKPMINYTINKMKEQGIKDITLALGYKAEAFMKKYGHMKHKIEDEPMGTGGAIKNCIKGDKPVLVQNGDTMAVIDYNAMLNHHSKDVTIAVDKNGVSAGIYIINPSIFKKFPQKCFSFEKDVIPHVTFSTYKIDWFTDYGVPETYNNAPKDWI